MHRGRDNISSTLINYTLDNTIICQPKPSLLRIDECRRWITEITTPPAAAATHRRRSNIPPARAMTATYCSCNAVVIAAVGCGGRPRSRLSLSCPPYRISGVRRGGGMGSRCVHSAWSNRSPPSHTPDSQSL